MVADDAGFSSVEPGRIDRGASLFFVPSVSPKRARETAVSGRLPRPADVRDGRCCADRRTGAFSGVSGRVSHGLPGRRSTSVPVFCGPCTVSVLCRSRSVPLRTPLPMSGKRRSCDAAMFFPDAANRADLRRNALRRIGDRDALPLGLRQCGGFRESDGQGRFRCVGCGERMFYLPGPGLWSEIQLFLLSLSVQSVRVATYER